METAAKCFICAFFLLIVDPVLVLAGSKFGIGVRPALFYLVIAGGLLGTAIAIDRSLAPLRDDRWFFVAFAALVVLGAIMYRGENVGSGIGDLDKFYWPSSIGYVTWPALNLVTGVGLYLLARHPPLRRTILLAAFAALLIQAATMEVDMWWEAIFGDPNGRAGGLAQNANVAGLLVVGLASLTLPARTDDHPNSLAAYAMMLMLAAVFLSQSRTAAIAAVICLICYIVAALKGLARWPRPGWTIILLAAFGATIWFSPVLNPTAEQLRHREEIRIALNKAHAGAGELPASMMELPLTLRERWDLRTSLDESINVRRDALLFFLAVFESKPLGYGTGFTNKFRTGPHNEWLKLGVDEGVFAPLLWTIMLCAAAWRAFKTASPMLYSAVAVSLIASAFYHTVLVEPLVPVALAIALGASCKPS